MRPRLLPLLALALIAPLSPSTAQIIRPVTGAIAQGEGVYELTATASGRLYYVTAKGDLWMHDRGGREPTKLRAFEGWDIHVANNGSVLAFTKSGEGDKGEFVWTMPLDPKTGLPAGPERRASTWEGDAPRLSPDGRSIAFDGYGAPGPKGDHLVVVPTSGGPERVVASPKVGIDNIRWTPDGKALYFGAGPARGHFDEPTMIQRVSIAGGDPVVVARGNSSWPGLSPDGKLLAFRDTGLSRRVVITDTLGRRITTLDALSKLEVGAWSSGSTLITYTAPNLRRLHSFSLDTKSSKLLIDSLSDLYGPRWSPDGKQIALVRGAGIRTHLTIADANGRLVRELPRHAAPLWEAPVWSPDGMRLLYHNGNNSASGTGAVTWLDIAAAHDQSVPGTDSVPWRAGNPNPRVLWEADSKHVVYISTDSVAPGLIRHHVVREADIGGGFKDLSKQITAVAVWPLDKQTILVRPNIGEPTIARPTRSASPAVKILDGTPGYMAVPSVSDDGQWIALRRNPAQYDAFHMTVLDIVKRDGTGHATIDLPFSVAPGEGNPHFLPGNRSAIIVERPNAKKEHSVYLMSLPSGSLTKLFTLPFDSDRPGQVVVSRDGKTILYVSNDPVTSAIAEWDLTPLLARTGEAGK